MIQMPVNMPEQYSNLSVPALPGLSCRTWITITILMSFLIFKFFVKIVQCFGTFTIRNGTSGLTNAIVRRTKESVHARITISILLCNIVLMYSPKRREEARLCEGVDIFFVQLESALHLSGVVRRQNSFQLTLTPQGRAMRRKLWERTGPSCSQIPLRNQGNKLWKHKKGMAYTNVKSLNFAQLTMISQNCEKKNVHVVITEIAALRIQHSHACIRTHIHTHFPLIPYLLIPPRTDHGFFGRSLRSSSYLPHRGSPLM